jgi:hypothetical protein
MNVDWEKLQSVWQNAIAILVSTITHISNDIGATHTGALPNFAIPLVSSDYAGFMLGLARAENEFSEIICPVNKVKRR